MNYLKITSLYAIGIILISCQNTTLSETNEVSLTEEVMATTTPAINEDAMIEEETMKNEAKLLMKKVEEMTAEGKEDMPEVIEMKEKATLLMEEVEDKMETMEKIEAVPEVKKEPVQTVSKESIWNDLLQNNVSSTGSVDYTALKAKESKLDEYLQWLNDTDISGWSSNKSKAHWINTYNAYTLKLILNHFPTKSINDISEGGKGPWDISFCKVAGSTYTLNHIEHEILRKKYNDPRIHVGVNCASISCPQLPNKAMTEANVNSTLETYMKKFINDKSRNNIVSASKAELSEIFNWFKDDFVKNGTLVEYINKYAATPLNEDATISNMPYNWNLNGK